MSELHPSAAGDPTDGRTVGPEPDGTPAPVRTARAGRNLPVAIAVGLGLLVVVAASLAFRFERSRWAEIWRRRKSLDRALEGEAEAPPPAPSGAQPAGAKPAAENAER